MTAAKDLLELLPGNDRPTKTWTLTTTVAALAAAAGTRKLLASGWRAIQGEDPPRNPADPSVSWKDALSWAAATGVAVTVARLLARRGAAAGWKKVTGNRPPM